jgi:hypothetical protein
MEKTIVALFIGIFHLVLTGCVADTGYPSYSAYNSHYIHTGYRDIHSDGLSDSSYNLGYGRVGYVMNDYGFGGYDGGYYSREWIGR